MISGVNCFIDTVLALQEVAVIGTLKIAIVTQLRSKNRKKIKAKTSQSGGSIRHSDMRHSLTFDPSNFQELSIFFSSCTAAFNQISKVWML